MLSRKLEIWCMELFAELLCKFTNLSKIFENPLPNSWRPFGARRHGRNRIVNTRQNELFVRHPLVPALDVSRRSINIYAISFIRAASKRDTRVNALGSRGATRRLQTHATGSNVVL